MRLGSKIPIDSGLDVFQLNIPVGAATTHMFKQDPVHQDKHLAGHLTAASEDCLEQFRLCIPERAAADLVQAIESTVTGGAQSCLEDLDQRIRRPLNYSNFCCLCQVSTCPATLLLFACQ